MISRTFLAAPLARLTPAILTFGAAMLLLAGCNGDSKPGGKPGEPGGEKKEGDSGSAVVNEVASNFEEAESVDSAATYSLRVNPKVGEVYSYRVTQSGTTEFEGVKATEEAVYNFTQRITGVNNDGSFTVEMRYDSIRAVKSFPAGVIDTVARTIRYDTRGKVDTTISEALQAKMLIGQRVNLTLSSQGEVREISNLEPIVNGMLGKLRDSVPPQAIERIRHGIRLNVFQAIVQQLFLQSTTDSIIRVGSEWTRRDSVPLVLPIASIPSRATVIYKVVEIKKVDDQPLGRVSVTLATTFPQRSLEDASGKATVDDASATGSGDVLLNLNNGFPVRKTTKISVRLKLTGSAKTGPNAGKSTTLGQAKSTTTMVELLDYKPAAE